MGAYFKLGNLIELVETIVSSGGITTLVASSRRYQQITGTQPHTVKLPDATTLPVVAAPVNAMRDFLIANRSTQAVSVQNNSGSVIGTVPAGENHYYILVDQSTANGVWSVGKSGTGGSTSGALSEADKTKLLASLAGQNYQDANVSSSLLRINPDSVGSHISQPMAPMPAPRALGMAFEIDQFAHVAGGFHNSNYFDTHFRMDPLANAWATLSSFLPSTRGSNGAFSIDLYGYLVDGTVGGVKSNTVIEYDYLLNTWSSKQATAVTKNQMSAMQIGGYGYSVCGENDSPANSGEIERYDRVANAWTLVKPDHPQPKQWPGAVGAGGFGYVAGGYTASVQTTTHAYNPVTESWLSRKNLNTPRQTFHLYDVPGGVAGIWGDNTGIQASSEVFVPELNDWKTNNDALDTTSFARYSYFGAGVNGIPYVFGGIQSGVIALSSVYRKFFVNFIPVADLLKAGSISEIRTASALGSLAAEVPISLSSSETEDFFLFSNRKFSRYGKIVPGNTSLITNGTFDTDLSGWTANGSLSASWSAGAASLTRTGSSSAFYQTITTVAGKSYRFKFKVNSVGGGGSVELQIRNGTDPLSGTLLASNTFGNILSPGTYTLLFTAQSTQTTLRIYLETQASFTAVIDDVSIVEYSLAQVNAPFFFHETGYGAIAGGSNGVTFYNTVEKYNPLSNTWRSLNALGTAKDGAMGSHFSGLAYAFGGYDGTNYLQQSHSYNEETNAFSSILNLPISPGAGYGSAFVTDAIHLIALGNASGVPGDHLRYDPVLNTYENRCSIHVAKFNGRATQLGGYGWQTCGGTTLSGASATNTTYLYDSVLDGWSLKGNAQHTRIAHSTQVMQGLVFVLLGQNSAGTNLTQGEKYNPVTDAWDSIATTSARVAHASFVTAGDIYVTSGSAGAYLTSTERFNGLANTWTARANISLGKNYSTESFEPGKTKRFKLKVGVPSYIYAGFRTITSTNVPGNAVGMLDGLLASMGTATLTVYDPVLNDFLGLKTKQNTSLGSTGDVMGGYLYQVGGTAGGAIGSVLSERYASVLKAWQNIANLGAARYSNAVRPIGGLLYTTSGYNGSNVTNSEMYNPVTDAWNGRATSGNKYDHSAFVLNSFFYNIAGWTVFPSGQTTVERYDAVNNSYLGVQAYPFSTAPNYNGAHSRRNVGFSGVGSAATGMYSYRAETNVWQLVVETRNVRDTVPDSSSEGIFCRDGSDLLMLIEKTPLTIGAALEVK